MRLTSLAALSITVALLGSAQAADMPEFLQPPTIREFGSNWYLRGDIGYRLHTLSDGSDWGGNAIANTGLNDTYMIGAGAGVKWGWLRTDVTLDYGVQAHYSGNVPGIAGITADIDSIALMLNIYADLGTWNNVTPYIGAGAGEALVRTFSVDNTFLPPAGSTGGTRWNFAWAFMAGLGYCVSPNFVIDLGYRYLHVGDASSGTDVLGATTNIRGISANEVRLGFRYIVD